MFDTQFKSLFKFGQRRPMGMAMRFVWTISRRELLVTISCVKLALTFLTFVGTSLDRVRISP